MKSIKFTISILSGLSLAACAGLVQEPSRPPLAPAHISGVSTDSKPLSNAPPSENQGLASTPAATEAAAPAPASVETAAPTAHQDLSVKLKPAEKKEDHNHGHNNHHAPPAGVSPEKALGWLKNGNARFVRQTLRKDGQSPKDISRLASDQQPHSIVLSCSDSRVPPEVVFDQKLGEIFVVRTAGQALDAMALASIEYAVSHLGSKLIVVMGHESCGAVKAAHGTFGNKDAGSASLNSLVADIQPRIKKYEGQTLSEGALLEGWDNIEGVAKDLVLRSAIVREAVSKGELKISRALYHLHGGKVEWRN